MNKAKQNNKINWDDTVYEVHVCKPDTMIYTEPVMFIQAKGKSEEQIKADVSKLFDELHKQGIEKDFYLVKSEPIKH